MHAKKLAPASVYSNNEKEKKKEGKVWMDTVKMAPRLHFSVADIRVDSFLLF